MSSAVYTTVSPLGSSGQLQTCSQADGPGQIGGSSNKQKELNERKKHREERGTTYVDKRKREWGRENTLDTHVRDCQSIQKKSEQPQDNCDHFNINRNKKK